MSSISIASPSEEHRSPRVPGEFDFENDMLHADDVDLSDLREASDDQSSFLPSVRDSNGVSHPQDENEETHQEEREMNKKLMDVESSFLPEFSHLANRNGPNTGTDDTFLFGVPNNNLAVRRRPTPLGLSQSSGALREPSDENEEAWSPRTPPEMYKTPAPEQQNFKEHDDEETTEEEGRQQPKQTPSAPNTSSLETMSSSPTAAAAARTVSRVQSMTTLGGYETADERGYPGSPYKRRTTDDEDEDPTPRKHTRNRTSDGVVPGDRTLSAAQDGTGTESNSLSKRPRYLTSRSSQARLSYDSMASSNTDASDVTLGADFALQSGGALPEPRLHRKSKMTLSRQASLGSLISGGSGASDDEGRMGRSGNNAPDLSTLEEESPRFNTSQRRNANGPMTPKASVNNLLMPTDTIIANNVRDFEVPGTFARQYRKERSMSPSKSLNTAATTPGPKPGLTLKEHRSTVEKLGKENFDLKMKVHFLDQALQKRSEDGIKELVTENVQLKSDRIRLEKDNLQLRKQVRELQRKLAENGAHESPSADQGYGTDDERSPTAEEELIYLRERVEMNEVEIEKLRSENISKESEKRRLAEMVRSLGDTRAGVSDVGSREERDMWKDMLEAETIAREQSEEDNKRLRDEIAKVRQESFGVGRAKSVKSRATGSVVSRSSSVERMSTQNAEIDRLRHEVSELQKMIGAQASTLTSRNKEKERLYQEIEDLKLGRMGGLRSIAGDSILDRSASRARSNSRASMGTRMSRISDAEREELEARINDLRDSTSQLKLVNQDLQAQFDEVLAELDAVDAQAQADADQFNEELQLLTQERDNALRDAEDQEQAFQQLKNEAQEEIDGLGDELDAKIDECNKLDEALKQEAESVKALKAEMRSAAEGLVRLEEDAQNNLSRYQGVQAELDDANRELEAMEHNLKEAEGKIQRFTVQQESSHNEIAFLREEQDGDKIKIGDLESLLKKVHLNLESERDRARELDRRLAEERRQRDTVASKEKQEVQKMINDPNREASGAKDELRRVQKTLSSRDIESNTHKQRLQELEDSLRHVLGDSDGNRMNLISSVTKIQRELDQTTVDLEATRRRLDERESLLANRDQLLENQGIEYRKLTDAFDRERQARRQDKHSFEQSLKSHQQSTRALNANNSRIAELEQGRAGDRKRMTQLESQFKEQLSDRNQVLLTIWKKLSVMCGPDWAHNNSLINGNLPSQEVIGNMLFWPGFSRNLLLATKQVEGILSTFKDKIKRVERDLWKEYQALEHTLELRTKKLERIEESWERIKLRQAEAEAQMGHGGRHSMSGRTPEMTKLKGENRLLRAELQLLQQQQHHQNSRHRHSRVDSRASALSGGTEVTAAMTLDGMINGPNGIPPRASSARRTRTTGLERHHSSNVAEHLSGYQGGDLQSVRSNSVSSRNSNVMQTESERGRGLPSQPYIISSHAPHNRATSTGSSDAASLTSGHNGGVNGNGGSSGQEKWIHRLRELERRLKAEREARLLDRSGMRKRLEERDAVNEELRMELERERVRRSMDHPDESTAQERRYIRARPEVVDVSGDEMPTPRGK